MFIFILEYKNSWLPIAIWYFEQPYRKKFLDKDRGKIWINLKKIKDFIILQCTNDHYFIGIRMFD